MIDEARALYALDPGEFIAARNALAKSLKAAGRAADAAETGALRRPKLSEHALNRVAHAEPEAMRRLTTAIAAASDAQVSAIGGGPAGLREATAEVRRAMAAVVELAVQGLAATGASGEGQRDEIVNLIREFIAANDTTMLTEGVVGSSSVDDVTEIFPGAHPSGLTPTPKVARPPALKVVAPKGAGPNAGPNPGPDAGPAVVEVRAAERRRREQAERRERLQAKLAAAEDVLAAARQATREATAAATDAKDAVAEAMRQQVRAERHLATTRDRLDDAQARVAAAARALRDAETGTDRRR